MPAAMVTTSRQVTRKPRPPNSPKADCGDPGERKCCLYLVRRLLLQQRQAAQQVERTCKLVILGRPGDLLVLGTDERLLVLGLRLLAFGRRGALVRRLHALGL